jgi:hypothetical protein
MKNMKKIVFALLVLGTIASCKKKEDDPAPAADAPVVDNSAIELSGQLSTQTLDATRKYTLKGLVYVGDGQTLTIPAGTVIYGDKASKGALVVEKGGKIMAEGTAAKPIVFTSSAPVGYRNAGDWGGVILLGKGVVNQGTSNVVEGPADFTVTTGKGVYGGTDAADNSGKMAYVRVEYAGISYGANKEINSFTFAGIGSGTSLNHLQASYGGDDSFEWFGGSVDAKFLVSYYGWDDDFDTDFGYSGKVQFGYALRAASLADQSLSNGFESDNDATGSAATPLTSAKFSNITLVGPSVSEKSISNNYGACAHVRRNTAQGIYNSVLLGYKTASVNFDKSNGTFKVKNNLIDGKISKLATAGNSQDTTGFYAANKWTKKYADVLADTAATASPSVRGLLKTGSAATTGADFTNNGLTESFWTSTTYMGAFGTSADAAWDWTAGWLEWDPANKAY